MDVEHLGELRDRGARPTLDGEIVYLGGVEACLPLMLRSDSVSGVTATFSDIGR
ncbi:MAG: hypothetical protein ACR2NL_11725 [Acidimicrobiia bacterium]